MSSIGPVSGDPMVGLAVLMLENADRLGELDRQKLEDARRAMERASAEEVEAMRDAADAVATGALVQGGLTFVGGAVSTGATVKESKAALEAGSAISQLAGPMGALTGEVPRRHAEAEAATARQASESASFDAEEARNDARAEERQADAVLDRVGQILDTEAQGNLAVLGNF